MVVHRHVVTLLPGIVIPAGGTVNATLDLSPYGWRSCATIAVGAGGAITPSWSFSFDGVRYFDDMSQTVGQPYIPPMGSIAVMLRLSNTGTAPVNVTAQAAILEQGVS